MRNDEFNFEQCSNDQETFRHEFTSAQKVEFSDKKENSYDHVDDINEEKVSNEGPQQSRQEEERQKERQESRKEEQHQDSSLEKQTIQSPSSSGASSASSSSSGSSSSSASSSGAASSSAASSASAASASAASVVATAAAVVVAIPVVAGAAGFSNVNARCKVNYEVFTDHIQYVLDLEETETDNFVIKVNSKIYEDKQKIVNGRNEGEFTGLKEGETYQIIVQEDTSVGKILYNEEFTTSTTPVEPVLYSVEITQAPNKVEYSVGESFDPTGLVVTATYTGGSSRTLENHEYTIEGFDSSKAGTNVVTVTYAENDLSRSASFNVTIVDQVDQVVSLEIVQLPYMVEYHVGDMFDPTGFEAKATYASGKTKELSSGMLSFSGFNSTTIGTKIITATYQDVSVSFNVTVVSRAVVNSFTIDKEYDWNNDMFNVALDMSDPDGDFSSFALRVKDLTSSREITPEEAEAEKIEFEYSWPFSKSQQIVGFYIPERETEDQPFYMISPNDELEFTLVGYVHAEAFDLYTIESFSFNPEPEEYHIDSFEVTPKIYSNNKVYFNIQMTGYNHYRNFYAVITDKSDIESGHIPLDVYNGAQGIPVDPYINIDTLGNGELYYIYLYGEELDNEGKWSEPKYLAEQQGQLAFEIEAGVTGFDSQWYLNADLMFTGTLEIRGEYTGPLTMHFENNRTKDEFEVILETTSQPQQISIASEIPEELRETIYSDYYTVWITGCPTPWSGPDNVQFKEEVIPDDAISGVVGQNEYLIDDEMHVSIMIEGSNQKGSFTDSLVLCFDNVEGGAQEIRLNVDASKLNTYQSYDLSNSGYSIQELVGGTFSVRVENQGITILTEPSTISFSYNGPLEDSIGNFRNDTTGDNFAVDHETYFYGQLYEIDNRYNTITNLSLVITDTSPDSVIYNEQFSFPMELTEAEQSFCLNDVQLSSGYNILDYIMDDTFSMDVVNADTGRIYVMKESVSFDYVQPSPSESVSLSLDNPLYLSQETLSFTATLNVEDTSSYEQSGLTVTVRSNDDADAVGSFTVDSGAFNVENYEFSLSNTGLSYTQLMDGGYDFVISDPNTGGTLWSYFETHGQTEYITFTSDAPGPTPGTSGILNGFVADQQFIVYKDQDTGNSSMSVQLDITNDENTFKDLSITFTPLNSTSGTAFTVNVKATSIVQSVDLTSAVDVMFTDTFFDTQFDWSIGGYVYDGEEYIFNEAIVSGQQSMMFVDGDASSSTIGSIYSVNFDRNYISQYSTFSVQFEVTNPDAITDIKFNLTDLTNDEVYSYDLQPTNSVQPMELSANPNFEPTHEYTYSLTYVTDYNSHIASTESSFKFMIDGQEQDTPSSDTGTISSDWVIDNGTVTATVNYDTATASYESLYFVVRDGADIIATFESDDATPGTLYFTTSNSSVIEELVSHTNPVSVTLYGRSAAGTSDPEICTVNGVSFKPSQEDLNIRFSGDGYSVYRNYNWYFTLQFDQLPSNLEYIRITITNTSTSEEFVYDITAPINGDNSLNLADSYSTDKIDTLFSNTCIVEVRAITASSPNGELITQEANVQFTQLSN